MVIHGAAALLLTVLASNSMAASFDCAQASNFAEKEICRDGYLSGLDNNLSWYYKTALTITDQPDVLRQSQRDWLVIRDQCTTQKCLDQAIITRIKTLDSFTKSEKNKAFEVQQQQSAAIRQTKEAEQTRQADEARSVRADEEQARQQQLEVVRQQQALFVQPKAQPTVSTSSTYQASVNKTAQQSAQEDTFWQQIGSVAWKCALLIAILSSCWAVKLHRQKEATIYNDYTDAAITNLLPVTGLLIGLICGWLGMPHQVYQITVVTGVLLAVFYAIYASVKTNRGGLNIVLTIIAKLTFISVFYIVMGFLIISFFGGARRKGESLTQAEARQRREARQTRVQIVAASAGYSFFTAWLCRRAEFTSLSECLEFDPAPHSA